MCIYEDNGYENRKDYLRSMADWYGVAPDQVDFLADILGPSEDFDGLISTLEDAAFEQFDAEGLI
jgi:hypothetical protein